MIKMHKTYSNLKGILLFKFISYNVNNCYGAGDGYGISYGNGKGAGDYNCYWDGVGYDINYIGTHDKEENVDDHFILDLY